MRKSTLAALTLTCAAALTYALAVNPSDAAVRADQTVNLTAAIAGTSTTLPVNGVLYIYDNATALHHTRSVTYYDHDGYHKTAVLQTMQNPLGVVLKAEDIENNCGPYKADGGLNPPHGLNIDCHPFLHPTEVSEPLAGDLIGRYCRVPPPGDTLPCPFSVARTEDAQGTGRYLTVGDKDHGGLLEVDYYTNVAGTDVFVDVKIPGLVLVTRIVLLPVTGAPYATVVLS